MDVREIVLGLVAKVSAKDRESIEPQMDLVADLGVDSPKALELLVGLEEALGVEISDEDAASLDTVSDVVECALRLRPADS